MTTIRVTRKELVNNNLRLRVEGYDSAGAKHVAYLQRYHDLKIFRGSILTYTDFTPKSAFFHKLVEVK